MDESYQIYINRVARLTLNATYQTQLQNIQTSPKFQDGEAISFPGYTIITPPCQEDSLNSQFYEHLTSIQKQILQELNPGLTIPVPPSSFHLTVADLIWEKRYLEVLEANPQFEEQLKTCIQESFQNYQNAKTQLRESQWQILGLLIFPRALAVGLVPRDESSYEKIVQLRRYLYQNADLIALGIEQQYYFTAHVTLGYFGKISPQLDREKLCSTLSSFNDKWLEDAPQILRIQQIELRKFEDMMSYNRETEDPVVTI